MLSTSFKCLAALLSTLAVITNVAAVEAPAETRDLARRLVTGAPRFVVYQDAWVSGETGPPPTSEITGYNVFAMSFLLSSGGADQVKEWETLTAAQRTTIKSQYNAAGIALVASAFGSTEKPTSSGESATSLGTSMGQWVLDNDVDGLDIDYEDLDAFNAGNGNAENWLITFTQTVRTKLPQGQYIVTHAPLAPWFAPNKWGGGGYLKVHQSVGSQIDWYNIQFYNQGASEYTTCSGLLTASSSTWPETAIFQIAANGVPSNKLVIGKPATTADASTGYIAPSTLATCVSQAKSSGWNAGVMVWQYPDATAAWIKTVRGSAFPISGGGGSPTTTSPATTSTDSSGSGCSGVSAWSSSVAYVGGNEVTYSGHLWTAKWWTEADTPGGAAGVWTDDGACATAAATGLTSALVPSTSPTLTGPVNAPFAFLPGASAALSIDKDAVSPIISAWSSASTTVSVSSNSTVSASATPSISITATVSSVSVPTTASVWNTTSASATASFSVTANSSVLDR